MKAYCNGVWRTIKDSEIKYYQDLGYKLKGCLEPQPSQGGLYIIDDYTIGRLDSKEFPNF